MMGSISDIDANQFKEKFEEAQKINAELSKYPEPQAVEEPKLEPPAEETFPEQATEHTEHAEEITEKAEVSQNQESTEVAEDQEHTVHKDEEEEQTPEETTEN
jgi:hypothetical protein